MDAFSLALSFGTLGIKKKTRFLVGGTVGIFHFSMPLLGALVGIIFNKCLHLEADFVEGVIFLYIAFLMFKDFKNPHDEEFNLNMLGILVFALGVSIDSFGVGFALSMDIVSRLKSSLIFAFTSAIFTITGLYLGKSLNKLVGEYSVLVGAIIMTILSFINFWNFFF